MFSGGGYPAPGQPLTPHAAAARPPQAVVPQAAVPSGMSVPQAQSSTLTRPPVTMGMVAPHASQHTGAPLSGPQAYWPTSDRRVTVVRHSMGGSPTNVPAK
ncbi:unnamed protein product, partial [Polarella glacialis]